MSMSTSDQTSSDESTSQTTLRLVTRFRPDDIFLGRGAPYSHFEGNVSFRELVQSRRDEFDNAFRRKRKSEIALEILHEVSRRRGRFLRKIESVNEAQRLSISKAEEDDPWVVVSNKRAIVKIKQLLRTKGRAKPFDAADDDPETPATGTGTDESTHAHLVLVNSQLHAPVFTGTGAGPSFHTDLPPLMRFFGTIPSAGTTTGIGAEALSPTAVHFAGAGPFNAGTSHNLCTGARAFMSVSPNPTTATASGNSAMAPYLGTNLTSSIAAATNALVPWTGAVQQPTVSAPLNQFPSLSIQVQANPLLPLLNEHQLQQHMSRQMSQMRQQDIATTNYMLERNLHLCQQLEQKQQFLQTQQWQIPLPPSMLLEHQVRPQSFLLTPLATLQNGETMVSRNPHNVTTTAAAMRTMANLGVSAQDEIQQTTRIALQEQAAQDPLTAHSDTATQDTTVPHVTARNSYELVVGQSLLTDQGCASREPSEIGTSPFAFGASDPMDSNLRPSSSSFLSSSKQSVDRKPRSGETESWRQPSSSSELFKR